VAAVGDGEAFERGRDFGAWLLFIQAANVILMRPQNWSKYSFGPWLTEAATRLHRNKLATALANKLARISLSVLRRARPFDAHREAAAI
jgi:hypothetical protein